MADTMEAQQGRWLDLTVHSYENVWTRIVTRRQVPAECKEFDMLILELWMHMRMAELRENRQNYTPISGRHIMVCFT